MYGLGRRERQKNKKALQDLDRNGVTHGSYVNLRSYVNLPGSSPGARGNRNNASSCAISRVYNRTELSRRPPDAPRSVFCPHRVRAINRVVTRKGGTYTRSNAESGRGA
jgi:hypothetical protein